MSFSKKSPQNEFLNKLVRKLKKTEKLEERHYNAAVIGTGDAGSVGSSIVHKLNEDNKIENIFVTDKINEKAEWNRTNSNKIKVVDSEDISSWIKDNEIDLTIISAGKDTLDRNDALLVNAKNIRNIAENFQGYQGSTILLTNPVDTITQVFAAYSGCNPYSISGFNHMDELRCRMVLAPKLNEFLKRDPTLSEKLNTNSYKTKIKHEELKLSVIGAHNENQMIPYLEKTLVRGTSLKKLGCYDYNFYEELKSAVSKYGDDQLDILDGLGRGGAYQLVFYSIGEIMNAIRDEETEVSMSIWRPELGLYTGWPTRFRDLKIKSSGIDLSGTMYEDEYNLVTRSLEEQIDKLEEEGFNLREIKGLEPRRVEFHDKISKILAKSEDEYFQLKESMDKNSKEYKYFKEKYQKIKYKYSPLTETNTVSINSSKGKTKTNKIRGFDLEEIIGEGSMGIVSKGFHDELNKVAAFKVSKNNIYNDNLKKEKDLLNKLKENKNIIDIEDCGYNDDDKYWIRMPYIEHSDGINNLSQYVKSKGKLDIETSIKIISQVSDALKYSHNLVYIDEDGKERKGILHRDIKPNNILLDQDLNVKLIDFSLAKEGSDKINLEDAEKTEGGGQSSYKSPEQDVTSPHSVDQKTDVYSCGLVLNFMLLGTFSKDNPHLYSKNNSDFEKEIPKSLGDVVANYINQSYLERCPTMEEFIKNLPVPYSSETQFLIESNADKMKPLLNSGYGKKILGCRAIKKVGKIRDNLYSKIIKAGEEIPVPSIEKIIHSRCEADYKINEEVKSTFKNIKKLEEIDYNKVERNLKSLKNCNNSSKMWKEIISKKW